MQSPGDVKDRIVKREPCPFNEFTDWATGDMPSMCDFKHFVERNRFEGESFEAAEFRLRRTTGGER